jgi:FKBP-type peptidyl-prolyl cis-trans isomerase FklB
MKKIIFVSFIVSIISLSVSAQNKQTIKPGEKEVSKSKIQKTVLKTMVDSASYAIGVSEAKFMRQQGITKINSAIVAKAIEDVMGNQPAILDDAQCNSAVMGYINKIQQEKSKDVIIAGEKFLQENKKRPEVKTTPSGLQYEVLREGSGIRPAPEDSVTCHYAGTLINGTEVDNSYKRGEPVTFHLSGVIAGWTEGLQHMPVGSKYKFYIPYQLAYGTQGSGPIPGGAALIFEVELLNVKQKNP